MSEQKRYSCVKKTKKTFENSLTELSKEYPLNKITVKALCEKAAQIDEKSVCAAFVRFKGLSKKKTENQKKEKWL